VALLAATQGGCISACRLAELGWTRSQSGGRRFRGKWRSLLPGVYLVGSSEKPVIWSQLDLDTRLWAARLMHGPLTVFCGPTAARLLHIQGLPPDDGVIHVRLPPGCERHQVPGVRVHTQLLRDDEFVTLGPFTLTSPLRTVLDMVLNSRREVAVSALDSALNKKLLVPDDIEEMRRRAFGRRGAEIAAGWWKLADSRAESPLETRTRLIVTDADMPPDELAPPRSPDADSRDGWSRDPRPSSGALPRSPSRQ
jgi:hypothetical protein